MEMPRSLKRKRRVVVHLRTRCCHSTVYFLVWTEEGRRCSSETVEHAEGCPQLNPKFMHGELGLRFAQQVAPYLQVANAAVSTKGPSCTSIPSFVRLQVTYQNKEKLARTRNLVVLKASTGHVSELSRHRDVVLPLQS